MKAIVVDTEVSQLEAPEIIELAYREMISPTEPGTPFAEMYRPKGKLSCGAMSVHHIIPEDLMKCSPSSEACIPAEVEYIIGHNIDFDWEVLGKPNVKRICTMAIARAIWPEVEGHTLGACTYRTRSFEEARTALKNAHSAPADVELCIALLHHFATKYGPFSNFEDLYAFSEDCRLPRVWAFGKFKGKPLDAADNGYLSWCLKQPDMDEYVKLACRRLRDSRS